MRIKALIALCTDKGTRRRGEVFLTERMQGEEWVRKGKVEEVPDEVPTTAIPRAKRKGAPKRQPVAAPPAPVVPEPEA